MAITRIRLGISSCLLGEAVRYDGHHKRDMYVTRTLARYVEFIPVCPEVGIGMGVPRAPIHLVGWQAPRALGRANPEIDVTTKLTAYGRKQAARLDDISGYIFKSRSPSCGVFDVPVHNKTRVRPGRGIYAAAFLERHPWLPAEDETRLGDALVRDNFIERVFAYARWQRLAASGITAARLIEFHAAHKYALMAHRPRAVSELGKLVADAGRGRARKVARQYLAGFMMALARPATPAGHQNALLHLAGYLHGKLAPASQQHLIDAICAFRAGSVSRAQVLTLMRAAFRAHPDPYVLSQVYLFPVAAERKLRNL
jgi:uncharacterized protein YbbK (DUF523 family)/uncharacterized protein YbgA (DUF1722 family)